MSGSNAALDIFKTIKNVRSISVAPQIEEEKPAEAQIDMDGQPIKFAHFHLAAEEVIRQMEHIHSWWVPDLIIGGIYKFTWNNLKRARPHLAEAVLDAQEAIDFEFGRYQKGESSWNNVQGKINEYTDAWEAIFKGFIAK